MKITAINTSPRTNWNTATLVKEAAAGAASAGAEIQYFDLCRLEKYSGCISCFRCKREPNEGKCVYQDGLEPVLRAIREADGVIIGTPNYLGQPNAGFIALYERLVFQNLTYQKERWHYHESKTPALFIMTSNMPEEGYRSGAAADMIRRYQDGLTSSVGPTEVFISGDTLQVKDYSRYHWTLFDPAHKQKRHDAVFPKEKERVFRLGAALAQGK